MAEDIPAVPMEHIAMVEAFMHSWGDKPTPDEVRLHLLIEHDLPGPEAEAAIMEWERRLEEIADAGDSLPVTGEMANEFKKLQQHARELAPEASEQEFLEAHALGSVCERCGRGELDDENETDCQLIPNPDDSTGPWLLVCSECFTEADRAAREQA